MFCQKAIESSTCRLKWSHKTITTHKKQLTSHRCTSLHTTGLSWLEFDCHTCNMQVNNLDSNLFYHSCSLHTSTTLFRVALQLLCFLIICAYFSDLEPSLFTLIFLPDCDGCCWRKLLYDAQLRVRHRAEYVHLQLVEKPPSIEIKSAKTDPKSHKRLKRTLGHRTKRAWQQKQMKAFFCTAVRQLYEPGTT